MNNLTKRETEVAFLLADGLTLPETAKQLFISLNTVKTTVLHIHRKLGVTKRGQLLKAVYEYRVQALVDEVARLRRENERLRARNGL